MGEMTLGGGLILPRTEYPDAVSDARHSQLLDRDPDFDLAWEAQRREVAAGGFHRQANRIASFDIQQARLNQPAVHCGVEPLIIDGVVDMAVDVVVGPARREAQEPAVSVATTRDRA